MKLPRPPERRFILGADVLQHLWAASRPLVMVDRVLDYAASPALRLSAERYVSANEPVFAGHFPNLMLWPGVHTLEGLRQSCVLLERIRSLDETGLLGGMLALQDRQMLKPGVDEALCRQALDGLAKMPQPAPYPLSLCIKLLAPVFAGCVIHYQVRQSQPDRRCWSVQAVVDGVLVAKGSIKAL